jgi:hypothetical protein
MNRRIVVRSITLSLIGACIGAAFGWHQQAERRDAYACATAVVRVYKGTADPSPCFTSRGLTPPWDEPAP